MSLPAKIFIGILIYLVTISILLIVFDFFPAIDASTKPAFKSGDAVIVNRLAVPKPGDLVAYRRDWVVIVHRVINVSGDNLIVSGADGVTLNKTRYFIEVLYVMLYIAVSLS